MREKYCSGWKNKLNKTDYKPYEQGLEPELDMDAYVDVVDVNI
jgi:hypothetical protein